MFSGRCLGTPVSMYFWVHGSGVMLDSDGLGNTPYNHAPAVPWRPKMLGHGIEQYPRKL